MQDKRSGMYLVQGFLIVKAKLEVLIILWSYNFVLFLSYFDLFFS